MCAARFDRLFVRLCSALAVIGGMNKLLANGSA